MKNKSNYIFEYIIPIIIFFTLFKFLSLDFLEKIIKDNDKVSLLTNISSMLIGFIITTISIFASISSRPLINISKNKKTLGLIMEFALTLLSLFLFLGAILFDFKVVTVRFFFILSVSQIFQYCSLTLKILYLTIHDVADSETENEKITQDIIKKLGEIINNLKKLRLK